MARWRVLVINNDWELYGGLHHIWQLRKEIREQEEARTSTAQSSSERLAEIERIREELRSYLRSSGPRVPAHPLRVEFAVPLYVALWSLESQIYELKPGPWNSHLSTLGLMFRRPNEFEHGGYVCTPINSLSFGYTGGDGEHFSFLVQDGRIDSQSPIVLTTPCGDPPLNWIVGRNFHQFMQFGLARGFQALAKVGPDSIRSVFNNPDWRQTQT